MADRAGNEQGVRISHENLQIIRAELRNLTGDDDLYNDAAPYMQKMVRSYLQDCQRRQEERAQSHTRVRSKQIEDQILKCERLEKFQFIQALEKALRLGITITPMFMKTPEDSLEHARRTQKAYPFMFMDEWEAIRVEDSSRYHYASGAPKRAKTSHNPGGDKLMSHALAWWHIAGGPFTITKPTDHSAPKNDGGALGRYLHACIYDAYKASGHYIPTGDSFGHYVKKLKRHAEEIAVSL